ncbi:MAG: serine/threonine-protein phosphatase [Ignavibacteriales bacterium CG_4_9_14_3_um_filter_30_11]|nr:MAG: serine/threonine-protein phosphatase [Ignavibacteriales bacterium CG_4_9_14_3_um_filter_30_11]
MIFNYITVSRTGLKREHNEDHIGVFEVDGGLLIVVCDGLGGNQGGEIASKLAVDIINEEFKNMSKLGVIERIQRSILKANDTIIQESSEDDNSNGMATTAEVLFLKKDFAYWGHVGDSRIYSSRKEKLQLLSKDHSLVQRLIDEGYITLKEAENHPNKNIITRALGDNNVLEVDLSKMKLKKKENNRFLVCTDGVSGVLTNNEIEILINNSNLSNIADKMSQLIEERGAPDNYSFVLLAEAN